MSTIETKPEETKVAEISLKKTYEYFDENLVMQSKEVEVKYTPAVTYEEGVQRLNSDTKKILEGINVIIRREALLTARHNAGADSGINRAVLMEFIKPYRELPQFSGMIASSDKRKATSEEWNKQTSAILEQIKNVSFIMQAIKGKSALANAEEE